MTSRAVIDALNVGTMRAVVSEYAVPDALTPPEHAALELVRGRLPGRRVLDIGVGGGRTVKALAALADTYLGIDYVPEMVAQCRRRYPLQQFEQADARSMPQFGDAAFDLIVFSCNGICMVDHEGRLAILREVRRLLRPGGYFLFSTYNRNSAEHAGGFVFPEFRWSSNPVRLLVRSTRFVAHTLYRAFNRARYRRLEVRHADYTIRNDKCHHFRTLLYYIDAAEQKQQLQAAGFVGVEAVFDLAGEPVVVDATDDSLLFVAVR